MNQDLTFELDQGVRVGAGLAAAAALLAAPALVKGALVAGYLAPGWAGGPAAYWAWVLVGGPLAFVLAQGDVYAVRRVGLALSPAQGRWEVARAALSGVDRTHGRLEDLVGVELVATGPRHAVVRLLGRDGALLAEVPGAAGDAAAVHERLQQALAEVARPVGV